MTAKRMPDPDDQEDAFMGGCLTLILGLVFAVAAMLFGVYRILEHHR